MTVKAQEVLQVIPDAEKALVVVAGATKTWAARQCQGFSQLRGTIRSTKAGTLNITQTPLEGTTTSIVTETELLVAATPFEFVVDITGDYITIAYTDPGGPGNSAVQVNANLYPVSALESNRSAASADVVETKLGTTGAHFPVAVPVPPAPPILAIAANPNRREASLFNNSPRDMYWGYDVGVTAVTGFRLRPSTSYAWKNTTAAIYVIGAVGGGPLDARAEEQRK